ncbi:MAG: hypothetical protein H7A46_16700 [Verrucomicrobiales bacterium]|nr:hypothetical protein [Verrucomicrobiales bacterium]
MRLLRQLAARAAVGATLCTRVLPVTSQTVVISAVPATPDRLEQVETGVREALADLAPSGNDVERVRKALHEVKSLSSRSILDTNERAAAAERILRLRLRLWAGAQEALVKARSEAASTGIAVIRIPPPFKVNDEDHFVDLEGHLFKGEEARLAYARAVAENRRRVAVLEREHTLDRLTLEARAFAMGLMVPYLRDAAGRERLQQILREEMKNKATRVLCLEELAQRNPGARELLARECADGQ